jgi:hypothetical protein
LTESATRCKSAANHLQGATSISAAAKLQQGYSASYRALGKSKVSPLQSKYKNAHLPTPPVDSVVVGGEPPWLVVVCVVPPTLPELNEDAPGPDV